MLVLVIATFTFSSCEDVPAPYNLPTSGSSDTPEDPNEKGGENNPYTCTEAAALISAGNIPSGNVCVKGIISKIQKYDDSHKSITYYISDDGKATTIQVYSGKGLNNADFNSADDLQVGKEVVVKGPLKDFNGQAEINYDNYIVSIKDAGTTPDVPGGKGSETDPYTTAEAAALISAGNIPSGDVCVKGIISQIQRYDATHKSITYYISDNGKATTLQVYSGKGLNGADFTAETDLQVGWTVVVKGPLKDFNGQAEMNYDNQILSIDKTSTPDTPETPDDPNKEVAIDNDNKTTTLTNTKATAGTEEVTFDANDIKDLEDAAEVSSFTLSDGTTITFGAGANEKSKPVFKKVATGNTIRVYKNNTITFNGKAAIAKVIIYFDEYNGTKYPGNTTATIAVDGNKLVYTNYDPAATGGGTQLRLKSIKIIYAK